MKDVKSLVLQQMRTDGFGWYIERTPFGDYPFGLLLDDGIPTPIFTKEAWIAEWVELDYRAYYWNRREQNRRDEEERRLGANG